MKTLLLSIACLFSALSAVANAVPGSFSPVSIALTVTFTRPPTSTLLQNGNTRFTVTQGRYTVNNAAIFAEATRRGLLDTSDYRLWRLVAVFDQEGSFIGFFAHNATENRAVNLSEIISPDPQQGSRTEASRWVRSANDELLSGSSAYTDAVPLYLGLNETVFTGLAIIRSRESVRPASGGGVQWVPGAATGSFNGYTSDGGQVFVGSIRAAPAVQVADLRAVFLPQD